MQPRIKSSAMAQPDVTTAVQHLFKAMYKGDVPHETLELVHLRASQINGCSACVDAGVETSGKAGVSDERLHMLVAWREAPYFTDAERAALELTEAATRMADAADPVPDHIWDEAADHFDENQLSSIVLMIATTNFFNRINRTLRVPAGTRWG
jgi:AhpD family alkylhydroperoxidase